MPLSKLASVKSIVLIELYLEPSSILLKPASDRIRTDYTMTGPVFFTGFALFSGKGGLKYKVASGIDRALRVLLGSSVGRIGARS
jgi:hypothetical protein